MHDEGIDCCFIIPAAGLGTRVGGRKPFIERYNHNCDNELEYGLDKVMAQAPMLPTWIGLPKELGCPPLKRGARAILFDKPTKGAAETIASMLQLIPDTGGINPYEWLLISNCDNVVGENDIAHVFRNVKRRELWDGYVFTFKPLLVGDTRFSYVEDDGMKSIQGIVEKQAISDQAVAGVYLLRMNAFISSYRHSDINLSDTLAKMIYRFNLKAVPVEHYEAWNDAEQLAEWRAGKVQHRR